LAPLSGVYALAPTAEYGKLVFPTSPFGIQKKMNLLYDIIHCVMSTKAAKRKSHA
jgi:hypothetical protein